MNILLFTNTFFPTVGGAEFVVHHLGNELARRGHRITVLAPRPDGGVAPMERGYALAYFSKPSSQRFGVRQLLLPLAVQRWKTGFEILHCHNAYYPGYVGVSFKRWFGVSVVITCHGTDIMKTERLRQNPRMDKRVRMAVRRADAVTAISRYMQSEILEAGADPSRVELIPNGVDAGLLGRGEPLTQSRRYLFSMGSFRKRKGMDLLLKAFAQISARYPEIDLIMAGDGKEKPELERLRDELGLAGRVQMVGNVFGERKVGYLKGAEFFVCPSRWQEPFGLINLEALAAGNCCVAFRVGGIPDVVEHGINGLLADEVHEDALAREMEKLLADAALCALLRGRARETAQRFTWSLMAERFERLYERLLAKS